MNNAMEVILKRRSVRSYLDEPIQKEQLDELLKAGLSAPSAKNSRPWEFLVVQNKEMLLKLSVVRPTWGMLKNAGAGIIVIANTREYLGSTVDFYKQDCAAAAQNILLAATTIGLGGVWLGLPPDSAVEDTVRGMFAIPEDIKPFCVLSIGVPKRENRPREEFEWTKVHYEVY